MLECSFMKNGKCECSFVCVKKINYEKGLADGAREERKKIMEIVDNAQDTAEALCLLGNYMVIKAREEGDV